jgi:adenosylcobyric acid synthase
VKGGLLVCGTGSDAGKSFLVAGLCRLLARAGVKVAPFKAQNMANNARVTVDGSEIGHAQWIQAIAAGVEPEADMNPVLLKPTGEAASQVVVRGRPLGTFSAARYQELKPTLLPVVLECLERLRERFDVVVCEGAGSPAEPNLWDSDIVNLRLAAAAGLPAVVIGDIERGGVFAALFGTVALLPDDLRPLVRGFVVNRFRGDRDLLDPAVADLERRTGLPVLGVIPRLSDAGFSAGLDAEDSLALRAVPASASRPLLDVAAVAFPAVANFGDLDPLRVEPGVAVRWVRHPAELGRPHLVVLPGSKATRADLAWFRASGLAGAVEASAAPVVAICAGVQMAGRTISDEHGAEGLPGQAEGLGWLDVHTAFDPVKVLDLPAGTAVRGPGVGERVAGYRIHHGRVDGAADPWLVADDGSVLGWQTGRIWGTTLHGLFEADGFRAAVLGEVAAAAGVPWSPPEQAVSFSALRQARLDRIADATSASVDLPRLWAILAS